MVTFQDGYTASADPTNLLCGCQKTPPAYSDAWLGKVVADSGDRYRLPDASCAYIDPDGHCHPKPPAAPTPMRAIPKHKVRGVLG